MAQCWECEATTSRPVVVTIALPTGHAPQVQLCQSCFQTFYLPLIAEASGGAAPRQAPRSVGPDPGEGPVML